MSKNTKEVQGNNRLHQATAVVITQVSVATVATRAILAQPTPLTMDGHKEVQRKIRNV